MIANLVSKVYPSTAEVHQTVMDIFQLVRHRNKLLEFHLPKLSRNLLDGLYEHTATPQMRLRDPVTQIS